MNKMKIWLWYVALFLPVYISAQVETADNGIQWIKGASWEQIKQKAKEENKYIFVDCYATWCNPCKWMDENVYKNDSLVKFVEKKFISVKIQMDSTSVDNINIRNWYATASLISSHYQVNSFPTYLFLSPNGEIVHRDKGKKELKDFFIVLNNALNPLQQFYTLSKRYESGDLDDNLIKYLIQTATSIGEKEFAGKVANQYLNSLKTSELFTKENIGLMHDFTKRTADRGFRIFLDSAEFINKAEPKFSERYIRSIVKVIIYHENAKPYLYSKNGKADWGKIRSSLNNYGVLGEEILKERTKEILFKSELETLLNQNASWEQIRKKIKKLDVGAEEESLVGATTNYYLNQLLYGKEKYCKNLIGAATYYDDNFREFLKVNSLNTWAWYVFEMSSDKRELNIALQWSKRTIDSSSKEDIKFNASHYAPLFDTYANLLYKTGRVAEALLWEQVAMLLEPDNNVYSETLDKMRSGKPTWTGKI